MKRIILGAAVGLACLAGLGAAQATPVDPLSGMATASVEKAQYYYGGRQYCFYPNGWRGPGFYWCGFNWRRGFGWGGPMGWQGWSYGPRPGFGPRPFRPARPLYAPRRHF